MVITPVFTFRNFGMDYFSDSNFIRCFLDVYFFRIIWNKCTILFSLNDNSTIPHQNNFYELNIDLNKFKTIFAGGITGAILGFLPGFGPAQGTVIAQAASGTNDNSEDDTVNFLLATSGLNISDCLFFFNGNLYNWKSRKRHCSLYVLFNFRHVY